MNGYLQDSQGNKSSGRLIKVASFIVAVGLSAYSIAVGFDGTLMIGMFLGVAIGSEGIQKATGK